MGFIPTSGLLKNGPLSEAHPDFNEVASEKDIKASRLASSNMSEEEVSKELESIEGEQTIKAKYKIEITYLESRKVHDPSACSVTIWESGKRFHGGGDQSMFWCLNPKNPDEGCGNLIPDDHVKGGVAMCPNCKRAVNQKFLPVTRVGVFSSKRLAEEVYRIWRNLNGNADIYLKFHITDVNGITRLKSEGKTYRKAAIYTLDRIIKDSVTGADITKLFENFLTA